MPTATATETALSALMTALNERGVNATVSADWAQFTAGKGSAHVVTFDGWRFQVDGGPRFFSADDCAAAIAGFEEDFADE